MYAATTSVALVGGEARPVEVQAHVGRQIEAFKLSGLPDTAVREAKDRVRAAVTSSGIRFPNRTVTVNLAPTTCRKVATTYDLPIALGILAASREIPDLRRAVVVGELALDGAVRAGSNALGAGVLSTRHKVPCLVASSAAGEAASIPGATVYGVSSLAEAVELLRGGLERRAPHAHASRWRGNLRPIWPTSRVRRWRGEPSRWQQRVATTCCCTAHPARARRCWLVA